MTQDEIIEMAREAGLDPDLWNYTDAFEAFAKLVEERTAAKVRKATLEEMIYSHPTTAIKQAVEYEREACAKVVEEELWFTRFVVAKAIRARGEAK